MGVQPATGYTKPNGYTQTESSSTYTTHANPLDRNHDGRVDLKDLTGQPSTGYSTTQGYTQPILGGTSSTVAHSNPLDRNHDGRVDLKDLTGQQGNTFVGQQSTTSSFSTVPGSANLLNGQPATGYTRPQGYSQGSSTSTVVQSNPLDRNHDGRVDLHDLTRRSNTSYVQSATAVNPLDRNGDGIVDSLSPAAALPSTRIPQSSSVHPMTEYYLSGKGYDRNSTAATTSVPQSAVYSQPSVVQTVTTTNDTFVPAKLTKDGSISQVPPTQSRLY
eukprot:TRINITY_DN1021_c0_g1_i3.p1 TRINITY_DN1021_c0_g1~~TRINITY_DN1021_c0_g1_i3.p1  ORF type:complete len:274 (+),score=74.74 TRINITY_DN1021_c0_g1_i3:149-970(+)